MIVGQDWGHRKYLYPDHEDESNPTNNNLRYLLKHGLGIEIKWNLLGKQGKLFFTNAVLCLRDNEMSMQGKPKPDWLDNCVSEKKFLRQQIEIVNPKVVVGLGRSAFESILRSFNLESEFPRSMRLSDIIQKKGIELLGTRAKAFAVYHCGARVTNTTRTIEMQVNDWQRICNALDATK